MKGHHKIRLWDKKDKQYVPIKNIWFDEEGEIVSVCAQYRGLSLKQGEFILESCSGVNSYDEDVIFEGDIGKDERGKIALIIFEEGSFSFDNTPLCEMYMLRIIGNIHENPELMEKK